jgi:CRP-like cAMP-binding protein
MATQANADAEELQKILERRIAASAAWEFADKSFASQAACGAVEMRFQPKEVIFSCGDPINPSGAPLYIVLEGKAIMEDELGVPVGQCKVGEMFGIGGALGIIQQRAVSVRAGGKSTPCVCAQLDAEALQNAFLSNPPCREAMETMYSQRYQKREAFQEARRGWIKETVIPALLNTPLLAGCPEDILLPIAEPLCESTFPEGKMIVTAGEPADSMVVFLEGEAEVLGVSGDKLGHFHQGAAFGDISALGLFGMRTFSVRALKRCRVLSITADVLLRAEPVKKAFSVLVESRREQVRKGLPLAALPLRLRPDDTGVCAVSMQAERIDIAAGELWEPEGESNCGKHMVVLAHGRAQLELEDRFVCNLASGALILEDVVFEYGAKMRAMTKCEAYRFRVVDFLAAKDAPAPKDWLYRFRLLEVETRKHMSARLLSVRSAERSTAPHEADAGLHDWKVRREKAIQRAQRMKRQRAEGLSLPQLPKIKAPTLADCQMRYVKGRLKQLPQISRSGMSKASSEPQLANLPRLFSREGPAQQALVDWKD